MYEQKKVVWNLQHIEIHFYYRQQLLNLGNLDSASSMGFERDKIQLIALHES